MFKFWSAIQTKFGSHSIISRANWPLVDPNWHLTPPTYIRSGHQKYWRPNLHWPHQYQNLGRGQDKVFRGQKMKQGGSRTMSLTWKYTKVCGYSDRFCKNLNQRSLTPRWPLTPHLLRSYAWLYPRIIVSKSHENTSKYMDTVTFFAKNLNQRSLTPRWPLTPHLLKSHVWLYPRIIVSKSYENTSKYMDIVTFFAKNLNQRSFTPRWPLTPHLLTSHVWLYPRIIVSKSHGNTSMYVDTVINFANYHIHTHTTYITTYRMSDHIVSFWTTFRRDKKCMQSREGPRESFKGAGAEIENKNACRACEKLLYCHFYAEMVKIGLILTHL